MAIRESLLNTITSVASSDFVRLVTSAGESSKATVANLFKSFESSLSAKSSLTTSDYIRVVGSDNVSYKQLVSDVADKIVSTGYLVYGSTEIPSNADLNTYRTAGVYTCPTGAVSQTLTNCPTTSAFRLEVKQVINADRYVQVLYVNYNIHPTIYWRTYNGAWSSWYAPALQSSFIAGSCTDTASSGSATFPIKYNNAYVYHDTYEVISAYESGHVVIPFISGSIWYVKVLNYSDMTPALNTQVTVNFRLLKK